MPSPPFPPRPPPTVRQDGHRQTTRAPPSIPTCILPQNEPPRTPRTILRHSHVTPPNEPLPSRPQPPSIPRSTTTVPYHHQHTSSSPELRPRADNAWAPRVRPYPQQPQSDLSQASSPSSLAHSASHFIPRPRPDNDDTPHRRNGFAARISPHLVPGFRGRSASDVRIAHTPPPDLEPDRLARACGQPTPISPYRLDDRTRHPIHIHTSSHTDVPSPGPETLPSHPAPPRARVGHMYRRLDALTRRSGRRAMDYVSFEDVAVIHKRDSHLREQLRRKRADRLQDKDPKFHAIGAPLDDVLLYASTSIVIGEYQHHLPIVVVACIEELTKTGIYQCGLFRALPSRDRHLQLIDLFDNSPDFGAQFSMRGQSMPDICALLSTFISSLPSPLLVPQIYSALWHWSVKPSVKREDARRDRQEEEEEDRRARGELLLPGAWMPRNDLYIDDSDIALETDQLAIAQILLRLLPLANLSLLIYLCAFFTQLPLCPENGLQLEDVARIFGHRLLGGSTKIVSQRMMMWLLTRWHRISESLFSDMCGLSPPPSPTNAPQHEPSGILGEENRGRVEKRKGKRESSSDDALHHTASSSSSNSYPPTESPEEQAVSSHKSSSDGEDVESLEGSRRRKKRELDVQPRTHEHTSRRSTRKEPRHGHGHGHARRGSGSRRHHHHRERHHEHKNAPPSPDPFANAFARAQQELADAPLLAAPFSSAVARTKHEVHEGGVSALSPTPSPLVTRILDTPVRVAKDQNEHGHERGRRMVDARVVDVLLEETAVATDAAKALAERVEVLERVLQVQDLEHPIRVHRDDANEDAIGIGGGSHGNSGGEGGRDGRGRDDQGSNKVEDGLRVQLRRVEAERDKAQQIVRDMRAYLLNEPGSVLGRE